MTSLWIDRAPSTTSDALAQDEYDEIVVGAGLTGLVTALLLARAGRRVVVLEARQVGAVTTGNTTGKLSLLQGTKYSEMLKVQSEHVAQAYVEANREGQQWLLRFCDDHAVPYQRRDAVTYAADETELGTVRSEHRAAGHLGLDVRWHDGLDVPFPNVGGTVLADQAQFDPMDVLAALLSQLRAHGGAVVEGARVVSASRTGSPRVRLEDGRALAAEHVILATGIPILDRGLYWAKVKPQRSYALAFDHPDPTSEMYLSAGSSTRSVRDAPDADGRRRLLVGGEGHPVGRTGSEEAHADRLREWTATYFPEAVETHAWSAQDYSSHDGIPFVGRLPRGGGKFFLATGYDKWGMTNAVAAGLNLSGEILGSTPSWARTLGHRVTRPGGAARIAMINVETGIAAVGAMARAEAKPLSEEVLEEGAGEVGRNNLVPAGRSLVDGRICEVVALCTHMAGTLQWNDAEKSWDCPLHGSRFGADGKVLEGPATRPLATHDPDGPEAA